MSASARVIVFDVNETLSDLSPLAQTFVAVGAPRELAQSWFAALLRDGFALTATGDHASFIEIAEQCARALLEKLALKMPLDDAVAAVLDGLSAVHLHPDVAEGLRQLHASGHRLFTLSNGATSTAERLFREANVLSYFEQLLSVDQHTAWKPAREAYERASVVCRVSLEDIVLVAVHPWDINGAARAGMKTAWVNRDQSTFPAYFESPTIVISSILDLPECL